MAALEAAMAAEGGEDPEATQILRAPRPRRRRRKAPLGLLAGLLVLAAAAAAVWALATGRFTPGDDGGGGGGAPVRFAAADDYDPLGDDVEHPELLAAVNDGDSVTWWRTETYGDFTGTKEGVGLILDAGRRRQLSELVVQTDTPGFQAMIQAGNSPEGDFAEISGEVTVEERTVFELQGGPYRYYVLWITDLDEVAHVNEVTARG
jgi:hypothetical protein